MKIGVLTLSLRANYGGTLQAWALMTVLKDLGHETWYLNRERHRVPKWQVPFKIAKRIVGKFILRKKNYPVFEEKKRRVSERHFNRFMEEYIQPQTEEYLKSEDLKRDIPELAFDAIVVGSDQVWRRNYISRNITDYFLGFLSESDTETRRIAYAASFGTEDWLFSQDETNSCRSLLKKFNSIGVREDSAVSLCQRHFGVESEHVIDPTLLLDVERYLNLLTSTNADENSKQRGILVYVLDEGKQKSEFITKLATRLEKPIFQVNKANNKTGEHSVAPSVEDWIRGFRDADFVVTDSFHGTVFSILFNKPFLTIGNEQRGMSRFTSLLRVFRLESRLVTSESVLDLKLIEADPDWSQVNAILVQERIKAQAFLRAALNSRD